MQVRRTATLDARQWDGSMPAAVDIVAWGGDLYPFCSIKRVRTHASHPQSLFVDGRSNFHIAQPGDWILKDPHGNLTVVSNEQFRHECVPIGA